MSRKIIPIRRTSRRRVPAGDTDLVIEIGPWGLRLRRYGKRRGVDVSWADLLEHFPLPASNRREAFQQPPAAGWLPARGETVWVDPAVSPKFASGVVTCLIDAVGGPLVGVRVGPRSASQQFHARELRPQADM